jgi:tetratricopeptide (TPR) repeat protein
LKLYEKSIDAYQYAVAIDEKFDYAYRNMGDAYLRLRKYKEAIEVLEKVLELTRPKM